MAGWKDGFINHAGPKNPVNFPFCLMGNKLDMEGERKVARDKGHAWAKANGDMPFLETSAMNN